MISMQLQSYVSILYKCINIFILKKMQVDSKTYMRIPNGPIIFKKSWKGGKIYYHIRYQPYYEDIVAKKCMKSLKF
jgi:hypothetical protein